jgi:drug/metabolite transporter (DMT)-like permease
MFASALLGEHFNYIQKVGGAIIILAVLSAEVAPVILEKARRKAT